jgi:hypothetical protein
MYWRIVNGICVSGASISVIPAVYIYATYKSRRRGQPAGLVLESTP